MLNERVRNRLIDAEAAKLTAKYGINEVVAYEAVKAIVGRYESELRKQAKQLAVQNEQQQEC